jgi:ATP-dependent Clp protease ATP-binding subunit ClpA
MYYAQEEVKYGNYVSTEHLLLGLLREEEHVASRVLIELGVDIKALRLLIGSAMVEFSLGPVVASRGDLTLTPRAKRVIDLAFDESRNLNANYIGTEHLLLALIREGDGLAGRVLDSVGVSLEKAREVAKKLVDAEKTSSPTVIHLDGKQTSATVTTGLNSVNTFTHVGSTINPPPVSLGPVIAGGTIAPHIKELEDRVEALENIVSRIRFAIQP